MRTGTRTYRGAWDVLSNQYSLQLISFYILVRFGNEAIFRENLCVIKNLAYQSFFSRIPSYATVSLGLRENSLKFYLCRALIMVVPNYFYTMALKNRK